MGVHSLLLAIQIARDFNLFWQKDVHALLRSFRSNNLTDTLFMREKIGAISVVIGGDTIHASQIHQIMQL